MANNSVEQLLFGLYDKVLPMLPDQAKEELCVNMAMIGVTGVGKTSTCNALLGTTWKVGHTEATTRELQVKQLILQENGQESPTNVYITDFPGLGESLSRDREYLSLYKENLPKFDAIIWLLPANDRQLSLIQMYCKEFETVEGFASKVIFGLNKADLVEPMEWGVGGANLPSQEQEANIQKRVEDFIQKMQAEGIDYITPQQVASFSAKYGWRIWEMFAHTRAILQAQKRVSLSRYGRPMEWQP
jgi:uncharacterized protein